MFKDLLKKVSKDLGKQKAVELSTIPSEDKQFEVTDAIIDERVAESVQDELQKISKETGYTYTGVKMVYDLVKKGYTKRDLYTLLGEHAKQLIDDVYGLVKGVKGE